MAKAAKFISEGGSSNRPPLFEGDDYYYWKDKMELFLRSQDNHMWSVIHYKKISTLRRLKLQFATVRTVAIAHLRRFSNRR